MSQLNLPHNAQIIYRLQTTNIKGKTTKTTDGNRRECKKNTGIFVIIFRVVAMVSRVGG